MDGTQIYLIDRHAATLRCSWETSHHKVAEEESRVGSSDGTYIHFYFHSQRKKVYRIFYS